MKYRWLRLFEFDFEIRIWYSITENDFLYLRQGGLLKWMM